MLKRADLVSLVLLGAIWGSSYLFIRIVVPVVGPWGMVVPRMLGAGLLLLAYAKLRGVPWGEWRLWKQYLWLAFLTSLLAQTLIATAALTLNSPTLAILNSTMAMFVALISAWMLGERIRPRRALGLALGVAGVALVVGFTPVDFTTRVVLAYGAALLAAFCGAYGTVFAARDLKQRPSLELATVQSLFAGLMALPLGVPALAVAWPLPARVIWALVTLAVVCTALAMLLYYRLMKRTSPTVSMSVTYLIPCFSLLWGWIFLGETIAWLQVAGFAVVLGAVALVAGRGR
jgi:drug/metabolite transporter (DMT)-like permease